jgi:hypothetical protein
MIARIDSTVAAPFKAAPLPEVMNHTPWPSQNFQHIDPQGDIYHVVVTRVTYSLVGMDYSTEELPTPQAVPPEQQGELITEDQYQGQLNYSSVIQESDFAPYKPLCDIILANAVAYAPQGQPSQRWIAGFKFGDVFTKKLQVTGPRHYKQGLTGWRLSQPELALSVPLCYELAYGGPNVVPVHDLAQTDEEDAKLPAYYAPNPIGTGRLGGRDTKAWLEQQCSLFEAAQKDKDLKSHPQTQILPYALNEQGHYRAPQIEAFEEVFDGQTDYPIVGVGPVARWWLPRRKYAGTHDERWKQTQWPKSPLDHDYRYWNCAPEDQQIAYPQGGEEIALVNLMPSQATPLASQATQGSLIRFRLPSEQLQVLVRLQAGPMLMMPMQIDTVVIDFASASLSTTARLLIPADLEVRKLQIGTADPDNGLMVVHGASLASSTYS